MPARRRSSPVELPHQATATLPDGRELVKGDEFTVRGEGRFVFYYMYLPDNSLTCFGPVNSKSAMWRSFAADRVRTIHRSPLNHRAKKAQKAAEQS